ncbi:hypothetical protein WJX72_001911 [[Myrmecia] bisecta]|uniref:Amine oxidase domain-containing protein n=1 Tax=[Myrmecia] bisecta TaxID=41462 RepID=A0AAW1Q224_9CHLO
MASRWLCCEPGQRGANPLAHILRAIGEPLELIRYDTWNVILPEGSWLTQVGSRQFLDVLREAAGPSALAEWARLREVMQPLAAAATALPPVALRSDAAVVLSVAKYLPSLLSAGLSALKLTGPFSKVMDGVVNDTFIRNWMDLLCYLLSGQPASGTVAAEVAFMFNEWYKPDAVLEFPVGGSQGMVAALVRGVKKHGPDGQILLNAHVEEILVDRNGRARGVRLANGRKILASKAVVSNATLWDTLPLLPAGAVQQRSRQEVDTTPPCPSFMHLHLGFDGTGLDDLEMHHIVVNSWDEGVTAPGAVVLISIASVADPSLAPPGHHTLHAYLPASELFELWQGLERGSAEYLQLKEERSQVLWQAVERIIPDIRKRVKIEMIGTPLTHRHFLRRHRGSYGPALMGNFAYAPAPVPGLMCCGDSTFPGIGLPAVAASGAIAANTLVPIGQHLDLLKSLGL